MYDSVFHRAQKNYDNMLPDDNDYDLQSQIESLLKIYTEEEILEQLTEEKIIEFADKLLD